MWVEFVVGSNSIWKARTRLNELLELFGALWVNKLLVFLFFLFYCMKMAVTTFQNERKIVLLSIGKR